MKPILLGRSYCDEAQKPTEPWPFVIVHPEKDDYGDILQLMWIAYFKDEPVAKALGIGRSPNTILEDHILKSLSQGFSLIAKCKEDDKIAGVCINEVTSPWDPDAWEKIARSLWNPRLRNLYQFYVHLQRAPGLWEMANVQKIFEIAYLCVNPEERGKGLGTALVQRAIDTGADCGYSCIRIDATSVKTQAICEKLNLKMVYELPYRAYIGYNKKPVIRPAAPEKAVKVYVATPLTPETKIPSSDS